MKKRFRLLLVSVLLLAVCAFPAQAFAERSTRSAQDKNKVLETCQLYLEKYWTAGSKQSFKEIRNLFLSPSQELFNKEMEVRTSYYNLKAAHDDAIHAKLLKEDLVLQDDLHLSYQDNIYTVRTRGEKVYTYEYVNHKIEKVSTDPTDIVLTFEVKDNKVFLIDLVDRLSYAFGKDYGINGNEEASDDFIPYGIDPYTKVKMLSKFSNVSLQDIRTVQLNNIEKGKNLLFERFYNLTSSASDFLH